MALHHAASGEVLSVLPLGDQLAGTTTRALYKSSHLEVFRIVLLAGKTMPSHQVVGEITVQCLEGSLEFTVDGAVRLMGRGDLLCLAGGVPHALKAIEDCSVLVTLLLPGNAPASGALTSPD